MMGRALGLALVCLSTFAVSGLVARAQALQSGFPPEDICFNNTHGAEIIARYMPAQPAENATVTAGAPVTFSGESKQPLTFSIASSPALLADPDIDSGTGSPQQGDPSIYAFTSTRASAMPRTVYWTASFTFTPEECTSPATFTSPVHTLVIVPSSAEIASALRQQEEEAARKQQEERAASQKAKEEAVARGNVVLDGAAIHVQGGRRAPVRLTCADVAPCAGSLSLTARAQAGKHKKTRDGAYPGIGSTSFSIPAGETVTVNVALSKLGRALLGASRQGLVATLAILKTSPRPDTTQTQRVRLEQQKH